MIYTMIERMRRLDVDMDLIRLISLIRVPILRFDKSSIKIYCTRVPFGFAKDKLPVKINESKTPATKNLFYCSQLTYSIFVHDHFYQLYHRS